MAKGYDPTTGLGYIQEGDIVEVTLPYARDGGQGVLVGNLFGIVIAGGAQGAIVNIEVERSVYGLVAATGANTDATQWAVAYWDDTNRRITPVATNNTRVGLFFKAKTTSEAFAHVLTD